MQNNILTRTQRYALVKVVMRQWSGKPVSASYYPQCAESFTRLETIGLIAPTDDGSYRLTINGAREMQSWGSSARPISHAALEEYIHDCNQDRMLEADDDN